MTLTQIYEELFKTYGSQGWWPIINNKTLLCEYKGGPKNKEEIFEVICGSILTQGAKWYPNTVNALKKLKQNNILSAERILSCDEQILKESIKSAGYYNQKAKKLKVMANFFIALQENAPTREQLLALWGIGKETADSILLYAYKVPVFVVDAYTRRIFSALGFIDKNAEYDDIQKLFEDALSKDAAVYQEYHALIVEHAKRSCKTKPECVNCILKKYCQ